MPTLSQALCRERAIRAQPAASPQALRCEEKNYRWGSVVQLGDHRLVGATPAGLLWESNKLVPGALRTN